MSEAEATSTLEKIRIVSASAGSGKTYRLTQELTAAITERGISPQHIVATTFTRKAAAELSERARSHLIAAGQLEAAERLDAARVGTVNSVCGRLAADFAFELGVAPGTDVLDEKRAQESFKRCLAEVTTEGELNQLHAISRRFWDFDWQDVVQRLAEQSRNNGLGPEALLLCAERSWAGLRTVLSPVDAQRDHEAALRHAIESFVDEVGQAEANGAKPTKKNATVVRELNGVLASLRNNTGVQWRLWQKASVLETTKAFEPLLEPVNDAAARFDSHPLFHQDLEAAIRLTFTLAGRTLSAYQAYKTNRRVVDFIDQETLALSLLQRDDVRARLRDEVRLVLVDEFQDTSPLQLAIFLELASLAEQSVWVGDQKQAIFGFRGTDPALMDAAVNAVAAHASTDMETLDKSWRSRPSLVDSTSALFAAAFEGQGIPSTRTKLIAAKDEPSGLGPPYERWVLQGRNEDLRAESLADAVADLLADHSVQVRDAQNAPRKLLPKDVAILCRRRKTAARVARALSASGVRCAMARSGLVSTMEGRVVCAALRLWADARDRLAAAELARIIEYPDAPDDFLSAVLQNAADARAADVSVPVLSCPPVKRVFAAKDAHPTASGIDAFDRIIDALALRDLCLGWGDAEARLANLDALRGHVLTFADTSLSDGIAPSPAALWAHLQELAATDEDSQALLGADDAVSILTWHAAKGLEWPVTVLYEIERDRTSAAWGISADLNDGASIDYARPLDERWVRYWPNPFHPATTRSAVHDRLAQHPVTAQAEARRAREELRLLYVGWTRARDRVVFAGSERGLHGGILAQLKDAAGDTLFEDVIKDAPAPSGYFPVSWAGQSALVQRRDGAPGGLERPPPTPGDGYDAPGPRAHPPRFLRPSDASAIGAIGDCIEIGPALSQMGQRDEKSAQQFGSALHAFLAADVPGLDDGTRREMAQGLFAGWRVAEPESELMAAVVGDALTAGGRLHELISSRWPGADVLREWPIAHRLASGTIVRGAADLVLRTDEGYVVIDHKTYSGDATEAKTKAATFAGQLEAYASAIGAATEKPVLGTFVHMPLHGLLFDVRGRGEHAAATRGDSTARPLTSDQIPQADSPTTLLAVMKADVVGDEYDGVSARQVLYYRQAARLFGLLDAGGVPTETGRAALEASDEQATAIFAAGFAGSEVVQAWCGYAGVAEAQHLDANTAPGFLEAVAGLAPSTARRRASTLRRWLALTRKQTQTRSSTREKRS